MKILVMCPGSFGRASYVSGLNSPERGEGRWAQNYARMLALAGHDVWAASGGLGDRVIEQDGCKLVDQRTPDQYGPFDLYFDAAWWDKKVPAATARKYVALKWSPEDYLRHDKYDDNFYIAYPYTTHHYNFSGKKFSNQDRAFALPTMFCENMPPPNWEGTKVFLPGKIDTNRPYQKYKTSIVEFLSHYQVEGRSRSFFEKEFEGKIEFSKPGSIWAESTTYDKVLESLKRSRISLPILNPGCIIEAACMGVPSLYWAHGGFFNTLAESLNILIEHDAPPERFLEIANQLMTNKKKYHEVVYTTQDYFTAHTFSGSLKYFNLMAETIGLL